MCPKREVGLENNKGRSNIKVTMFEDGCLFENMAKNGEQWLKIVAKVIKMSVNE
jgi:hypothetical protein